MAYNNKILISESERVNIKKMYGIIPPKRDYIFEMSVSVDGRYYIVHDEVFDIQEQRAIGNLWDSLDVFKTMFQNVQLENTEYSQIRESIISLPILEGKENLYGLRDILLEAGFLDKTWVGRQFKSAGQGIADFAQTSFEGIKKFGVAVSQGEWGEILNLLASGVKYLLRKLKEALYSTVGMTVDAILVATGIGKGVQWIPWALVLGLDVYQLLNNDWPEEEMDDAMWMKYLTIGFDALGLVGAGIAAKGAKTAFAPLKALKTPQQVGKYLAKSPRLKSIIVAINKSLSKVPGFLTSAQKTLMKKFPAGGKFLGSIMGRLSSVIAELVKLLDTFLRKTAVAVKTRVGAGIKSGATMGAFSYGIDKAMGQTGEPSGTSDDVTQDLQMINNIRAEMG
jgi:hypothetical protein